MAEAVWWDVLKGGEGLAEGGFVWFCCREKVAGVDSCCSVLRLGFCAGGGTRRRWRFGWVRSVVLNLRYDDIRGSKILQLFSSFFHTLLESSCNFLSFYYYLLLLFQLLLD